LLPAVQAAREAARRVRCQNNLKQVGLALHQYHNIHGTLPTGCIEWRSWSSPPTHRQFAWSALLLPFLEQQPLHREIDFSRPFDAPANAAAAAVPIATYLCPSTARSSRLSPAGRAQTDYGGLYGERLLNRRSDDGLFLYERSIAFREVRDGLSQTLAVAEDVGGPDREWINGRNVFVQSGGVNDPNAWIGDNEIRSDHASGAMALFGDGHIRFLSNSTEEPILGAMITRAGQEIAR
jgi:prepilin-type processing-associated H-X9-DG protein